PCPSSDVLGAHLDVDGTVRMNAEIAIARMSASTPGVNRKAYPARNTVRNVLPARMPFLFPAHQLRGDRKFVAIGLCLFREIDVLQEELVRIHVELGGEILKRAHGEHSRL